MFVLLGAMVDLIDSYAEGLLMLSMPTNHYATITNNIITFKRFFMSIFSI